MAVTGDYIGHLSHTCSLSMEEQFYLVRPVLLLALLRFRRPSILVAVLAVAGLAAWSLVPYNPMLKTGGLLIGCLAAFLVERRPWEHTGLGYAAAGVFVACLWAESVGVITREASLPVGSLTVPFVILHLAFGEGLLVRLLSSRPLVHLGVLSYGLYLWHYVILAALGMMGYKTGLTTTFIAAGVTYAAAALSFRFIEAPILRLKRRIPVKEPAPAVS